MTTREIRKQRALEFMRRYVPEGTIVYAVRRHATKGGNLCVDYVVVHDGEIVNITSELCDLYDYKFHREHGGLVVSDAYEAEIVRRLARDLFTGSAQDNAPMFPLSFRRL